MLYTEGTLAIQDWQVSSARVAGKVVKIGSSRQYVVKCSFYVVRVEHIFLKILFEDVADGVVEGQRKEKSPQKLFPFR